MSENGQIPNTQELIREVTYPIRSMIARFVPSVASMVLTGLEQYASPEHHKGVLTAEQRESQQGIKEIHPVIDRYIREE